ncbi:BEL1-like homeodomain protein 6 [Humulus lupulus]|uniref:BEL1-like homeodomain protein 6 n=1 Tax=Humulus lupulus TaxID=3486 RepID=UPI002B414F0C|nr:BEL1-like homeodomain protein 6 [Humulus lupulus]XP_062076843.1 BEL1-like homeodomain protein 6 [Humulus lupulus]
MATYYSSSNNQRDNAQMMYSREHLPTSYPEASVIPSNMMMYMNTGSYSDALAGTSQQQSNCMEMPPMGPSDSTPQQQDILSNLGGSRMGEHDYNEWRDGKNDMLVAHSMAGAPSIFHGGQNLQGQGLSLSLGTQISSGIQMPSISFRNPNMGFSSFLSPNPSDSGEGGSCRNGSSRDEQPRNNNVEYLTPGFPGGVNQDSSKGELSPYGLSSIARAVPSSKYLKAAQQLLDEVVNVRKALKQHDSEKAHGAQDQGMKSPREGDDGSKNESTPGGGESASNSQPELSHAEKQDLQNKLTKLLSMLDEVDRRYKQYYHQMQIVVSSFDAIAGCGSAKPYTALALQTISRHFRCLHDAIVGQIKATRKSLGEQDASGNIKGVGISRLRYVDQQLRQQRALQQLGMMQQHAWRPQRGLPESSVSILRAWLFEHFLHPYPKDSDKIMLARQTGLTRSQVSNWFINARVRLWKPMVEEMYKEEIGDAEMDSNSSSENAAAKATKGDIMTSEDRGEDLQQSASSTGTERCSTGHFMDSKTDHIPDVEMAGSVGSATFHHSLTRREVDAEGEYGLMKQRREEQRPGMDDCSSVFPHGIVQSDGGSERFMAAAAAYHMSELGRFGSGTGVSLTLGLQHCDGGSIPMNGGTHHGFVAMRGDDLYNPAASSMGAEAADFECINSGNQQPRYASSHLLHDFVV